MNITRIVSLTLLALALSAPALAVEKIDGYIVMEDEAAKVTDLNQKLARNVRLGPVEFGDYSNEDLTLYVFVSLLDEVPVSGKVHRIDFTHLSMNEIPFKIGEVGSSFEIPREPPYEINEPLVITASWSDAMEGGLAELADPSSKINLRGRLLVFGKLQGEKKKKKKYVVPVDVLIQVPRAEVGDQLDNLLRQYTLDQIGPTLEGMGIDPSEVDVERLLELLQEWAAGQDEGSGEAKP
jgi:hypothetical protein